MNHNKTYIVPFYVEIPDKKGYAILLRILKYLRHTMGLAVYQAPYIFDPDGLAGIEAELENK